MLDPVLKSPVCLHSIDDYVTQLYTVSTDCCCLFINISNHSDRRCWRFSLGKYFSSEVTMLG